MFDAECGIGGCEITQPCEEHPDRFASFPMNHERDLCIPKRQPSSAFAQMATQCRKNSESCGGSERS
ncbi:hypothetical protein Pan14r_16570 [Crateriforma conspicua]|uniref:Uncharacterized protein n=1 Tax=Crateriforma conspicua TaxID=2527996 RepID=A0A5C5Y3W5_9PLAN|nr:hypothetical protein Pan14r_16570 [Crateriforma conspicua]